MTDFNEDHSNEETKLDEETTELSEAELLQQELETERALRILADQKADNAKRDLIALKKGKKRAEVDLSDEKAEEPKKTDTSNETILEMARMNAELARALQAKTTTPVGGSGGEEASSQPQSKQASYWSEDQKNELRKRGWNEEKISRAENMARNGSATSSLKG